MKTLWSSLDVDLLGVTAAMHDRCGLPSVTARISEVSAALITPREAASLILTGPH